MRHVTIRCEDCGHKWHATLYTRQEAEEERRRGRLVGQPLCERCGSARCKIDG